jgi:hypothetical protein
MTCVLFEYFRWHNGPGQAFKGQENQGDAKAVSVGVKHAT